MFQGGSYNTVKGEGGRDMGMSTAEHTINRTKEPTGFVWHHGICFQYLHKTAMCNAVSGAMPSECRRPAHDKVNQRTHDVFHTPWGLVTVSPLIAKCNLESGAMPSVK